MTMVGECVGQYVTFDFLLFFCNLFTSHRKVQLNYIYSEGKILFVSLFINIYFLANICMVSSMRCFI